jgi:dihydrofolate reductase
MELATESNGQERYVTRKVINSTYISLDGAVEQPHLWPTIERPPDERGGQIQTDLLLACDAVLMGRRTYEGFAPVWQSRSGDPFSDRINTMPKYVVSTTLKDPDWANTTVISSDVAERIRDIKAEPGQDIVQYGFGRLSFALLEARLLDELVLWMHPFFVGRGGPEALLYRDTAVAMFELADVTSLASGLVVLSYRYAGG